MKLVLLASDFHVLSTYAILRPGFQFAEGGGLNLNKIQEWMWAQFESCLEEVVKIAGSDPVCAVLNGDLIDGNHHRTKEILHVDEAEHARAAIYTLQPLRNIVSKIYIVEGTESHTKNFERYIGKEIGAEKNPLTGIPCFPTLDLKVHGCLGHIAHHMPTSQRKYLESSQLAIQLGDVQLRRARADYPVPKWIYRAHRHCTGYYTDGQGMALVTPSWQGLTRFGRKVVPAAESGVGFFLLDWRDVEEGNLPHVHEIFRYPDYGQKPVIVL